MNKNFLPRPVFCLASARRQPFGFPPISGWAFSFLFVLLFAPDTRAQSTLYWDPTGTATPSGGTGTWDTTSAFWLTAASGGTLGVYDNTNPSTVTADFSGTAGTVTLATGVTIYVNTIKFDTAGYTIAGASGSLLNFSGTTPTMNNAIGGIETISAGLSGTAGFTAIGGGFTVLSGDLSNLTGTVNIGTSGTAGRVNLQGTTLTGSQFQTWNLVNGTLTSNNTGTGSTIQLGALSGTGTVRVGNSGGATAAGTDIFQIGALNTSTTFAGTFTDSGALTALTKVGTGTLTLTGFSTNTGGTIVNNGKLTLGNGGGSSVVRGVVTVNSGATLTLAATNALGYTAGSQVSTLNINGGTVNVASGTTGDQGFLTSFNLTGGTLAYADSGSSYQIAAGDATAPGITSNTSATTSTISGNVFIRSGTLGFTVAKGTSATDLLVSGVIGGYAGLGINKSGLGTMTLAASNTYTGTTTVNAGTLVFGTGGSLYSGGTVAGSLVVGTGAAVRFDRNDALGGSGVVSPVIVSVNGGTLLSNGFYTSLSNPVFNGATITGNGGSSAAFPAFSLRGTVTVGGSTATNINAGTGTNNNVALGTFNTAGNDSVTFSVGASANLNVNTPFSNQGGGSGAASLNGLIKSGPGTMTLGALNTYTGGTTVSGGTLALNTTGGVGTVQGAITVASGATLNLLVPDALGYTPGSQVTTVNVAGGTVNNSAAYVATRTDTGNQGFLTGFNLTGGFITSTSGGAYNFSPNDAAAPAITSNASSTVSIISAPLNLRGSGSLSFTVAKGTTTSGIDLSVTGAISPGADGDTGGGIIKNGPGLLSLGGVSTFTGATTINAGTLGLENNNTTAPLLANTGGIVLNTGGTLLFSQSGAAASTNRINNAASITLAGGTFNTGGLSEGTVAGNTPTAGLGALTLTDNSIIDLAAGASILTLANSSAIAWTAGKTLSIYNYSGTALTGNGTDQIYFGTNTSGLTASQLGQISFYSGSGTGLLGSAVFGADGDGEIVPVPEPATWLAGGLLVGVLGISRRRSIGAMFKAARAC